MLLSPQQQCNSSSSAPNRSDERRLSVSDVVVVEIDNGDDAADAKAKAVVIHHRDCDPTSCSHCCKDGQILLVNKQSHDDNIAAHFRHDKFLDTGTCNDNDTDACAAVCSLCLVRGNSSPAALESESSSSPTPPPPSKDDIPPRDGAISPPPCPAAKPDERRQLSLCDVDGDDEESSSPPEEEHEHEHEHELEHGTPTSVARLLVVTAPPPPPPTSSSSTMTTKTKVTKVVAPPLPLHVMPFPPTTTFPEALPFEAGDDGDGGAQKRIGECARRGDVSLRTALSRRDDAGAGEDEAQVQAPPPRPLGLYVDGRPPSSSRPSFASSPGSDHGRPVLKSSLRKGAEARYTASPSASPLVSTHQTETETTTAIFRGRRRQGRDVVVDTSWDFDFDLKGESDKMDTGTSETPTSTTREVACCRGAAPSSPTARLRRCTPTERKVRGLWNRHCHCPFSSLNDDVLMHCIFASYLTVTDLLNAHLVCTRWRYVASQPPCWRRLDLTEYVSIRFDVHSSASIARGATASSDATDATVLEDPAELTSRDVLAHLERHSSDVEALVIGEVGHRLNAGVVVEGIGPCLAGGGGGGGGGIGGRLTRLELGGYAALTDSHVNLMLSAPRLLSSAGGGSTVRRRAGSTAIGGGGAGGLEVLKLEECPRLTYRTACHVAANCPSTLRELSLRGNRNVTDDGIGPPLADLMRVGSFATGDGTGGGGGGGEKDPSQRHLGMNAAINASSSLPPSPSLSASPFPRSSSSPSLMDLFSPPPPTAAPAGPTPSSSPFAHGAAPRAPSTRGSPPVVTFRDVEGRRTRADDNGGECGGCLEGIDISRTRVTADGLLRAMELGVSRATSSTADTSARGRGRNHIKLSEIVAGGTGESWTDGRLVRLCRLLDVSAVRVFDLGCADPFGATRRLRRSDGTTTITDDGLVDCFAPPKSSRECPHVIGGPGCGRWTTLERLALSGHGPALTGTGVAAVLRNSPRLSDLDLGGCVGVGRGTTATTSTTAEESARALAASLSSSRRGGRGLRRLNLWRCFPGRTEGELAAGSAATSRPDDRNTSETGRSTTEEAGGGTAVGLSAAGGGGVISALCEGPTGDTLEQLDLDGCHFVDGEMVAMLRRRCVRLNDGGLRLRGTRYHEEERRKEAAAATRRKR